jgi:hypothetical protein
MGFCVDGVGVGKIGHDESCPYKVERLWVVAKRRRARYIVPLQGRKRGELD